MKRVHLRGAEPQLYVRDVNASCSFFSEKLGFEIVFVHGDPAFYGQVCRDDARLNLRMIREPVFAGNIREREQLLSASIIAATHAEIERLFSEYQLRAVRFSQALREEPWGAKTFVVVDPDGNLILFAGPSK